MGKVLLTLSNRSFERDTKTTVKDINCLQSGCQCKSLTALDFPTFNNNTLDLEILISIKILLDR